MESNALLERLKAETAEADTKVLIDLLDDAKEIILNRRYPFVEDRPVDVPKRYASLQYRIALELYAKRGAEGEVQHIENGIHRSYSSADVSPELLRQITPMAGGF